MQQYAQTIEEWHTIRVAEGAEVTAIAARMKGTRLNVAVASRSRIVARIDIVRDRTFDIFAVEMEKTVARTLAFAGEGDGLLVLGLYDGMLHTIRVENQTPVVKAGRTMCRLV